jgi:hypothetical protein
MNAETGRITDMKKAVGILFPDISRVAASGLLPGGQDMAADPELPCH